MQIIPIKFYGDFGFFACMVSHLQRVMTLDAALHHAGKFRPAEKRFKALDSHAQDRCCARVEASHWKGKALFLVVATTTRVAHFV
jgi:hypothetical protein